MSRSTIPPPASRSSDNSRFQLATEASRPATITDWTINAQTDSNFADSIDSTQIAGGSNLDGVDDSAFVHSGLYGAFLGQTNTLGVLSQTLPTIVGQQYLLSLWLANPAVGTPNEFQVIWDGTTLFDQSDLDQFAWTNLQYVVTVSTTSTILQLGFRNDQNAFALDDISVQPVPAPEIQSLASVTGGGFALTWSARPQLNYRAQYTSDIGSGTWTNLGNPITSTDNSLTITDPIVSATQRFYRVVLMMP